MAIESLKIIEKGAEVDKFGYARKKGTSFFAKGHKGGPGNPYLGRISKLKQVMYKTVTPEKFETLVQVLLHKSMAGDVKACYLLFNVLGLLVKKIEAEVTTNMGSEEAREHVAQFFNLKQNELIGPIENVRSNNGD